MKLIAVIMAVTILTNALDEKQEWQAFKHTHSKIYRNSVEEKLRFSIFQSNLRKIEEHNDKFNKGLSKFKMGITKFADLTKEEFLEMVELSKNTKPIYPRIHENTEFDGDLPDEIDWNKKGAVTKVKDQGYCGSCWSFSTTGSLEGANFIKTGKLVSLSEQNLVDCAKDCNGCLGGWMDIAFKYIEHNGLMTEEDYPYKGNYNNCQFNMSKSAVKVKSHNLVNSSDEEDLKRAVTQGPVSVAIDATDAFQLYSAGILDDETCQNEYDYLNHGVLAVGYGISNGTEYWIIKNSWGPNWGMDGFIWMSRNKNNQCGIATDAVYPIV